MNPSAELVVDFPEPEYQENPKDLLDQDIKEVEAGFVSPITVLMRRNEDLDEAQAKALYESNLEYRKATKARFGLADVLLGQQSGGAQGGEP